MVEQVGGEGVAQGVRRNRRADRRHLRVMLDAMPEGLAGHLFAAQAGEQHVAGPPAEQVAAGLAQVAFEPADGFLAERHQALLAALAEHLDHALAQVDLLQGQADQFADPQAAGIQHFEHGAIAQAQRVVDFRRRQQCLDVRFGEGFRQRLAQLRQVHLQGGILGDQAVAQAIAIEATQAGEEARGRAGLVALLQAPGQVIEDGVAADALQAQPATIEPGVELLEVVAISLAGVVGKAFFQPQGIEETVDQGMFEGTHG
ncbi:Uncharacterised protein [Klebsiella pneumoniae]|nr:Uncharacterised protein [Klebsiella pneumoniae]